MNRSPEKQPTGTAASVDRLLLLVPKPLYRTWPFENDFTRHLFRVPAVTFPQIAAALDGDGDVQVDVFDGLVERIDLPRYRTLLGSYPLVGINVVDSGTSLNTEITLRLIKAIRPGTTVVMGGHHASIFDREWIEKGADFVVRREGETAMPALVRALRGEAGLEEVPGITFRAPDGGIVRTPEAPLIDDLDTLPVPDWDSLNLDLYDLGFGRGGRTGCVESSRGCPHQCTFCLVNTFWSKRQRYKSPDRVIAEMEGLHSRGVRQLAFADDNWGERQDREEEILERMIRKGFGFDWVSFVRADRIIRNPTLVDLAARSGLCHALVGFEGSTTESLKRIKKGYDLGLDDFAATYRRLRRLNIMVTGFFVTGYPGAEHTDRRILMTSHRFCDISAPKKFIPFPRTEGYETLKRLGLKMIDVFYNDRHLPAYTTAGRRQADPAFLISLKEFLLLGRWRHAFSRHRVKRLYYRRLLSALVRNVMGVTPRRVKDLLIMTFSRDGVRERQRRIVGYYTSEAYIERLRDSIA